MSKNVALETARETLEYACDFINPHTRVSIVMVW
jgi:hypothetical protein